MSRLDRSVSRKDAFFLRRNSGLFKGESRCHLFSDEFQREKRGMTFVHVESRRLHTQRAKEPDTSYTQQHFLHNPCGAVSTVDAQGEIAKMRLVLGQIG